MVLPISAAACRKVRFRTSSPNSGKQKKWRTEAHAQHCRHGSPQHADVDDDSVTLVAVSFERAPALNRGTRRIRRGVFIRTLQNLLIKRKGRFNSAGDAEQLLGLHDEMRQPTGRREQAALHAHSTTWTHSGAPPRRTTPKLENMRMIRWLGGTHSGAPIRK
jgi:hypothetical protein